MKLAKYTPYKIMHPLLLALIKSQRKHRLHILNDAVLSDKNAIFAVNHSCKHDFPVASEVIGRHCLVLAGKQRLKLADRIGLRLNGVIYVDRKSRTSRQNVKKIMQDCIRDGQNVCVFPEGTWNLTLSKPMLPLYWGIIDIARETGCPIIPLVLEYKGDDCYAKWGTPVYVKAADGKQEKIDELSDKMASLKWEIWELFPIASRKNVRMEEWEEEVQRRIADYPVLDFEYEKSCAREA